MRSLRRVPKVKNEKITISLTPTEVGQIDYLVERGLYTNRSDFIRLAIRKQSESYSGDISKFLAPETPETQHLRYFGGLGIFKLTKLYVDNLLTFGAKVHINIVGALTVDKQITRDELAQVLGSCKVHGKVFAEEEIKALLRE